MEGGIDLNATLDYVEFHKFPSQNSDSIHKPVELSSREDEDSTFLNVEDHVSSVKMSVQDKISLFESKQGELNIQKTKTPSIVAANKAVLKRWSSGTGETTAQCPPDETHESSPDNIVPGGKSEVDNHIPNTETSESHSPENLESEELGEKVDTFEPEIEASGERVQKAAQIEVIQQKPKMVSSNVTGGNRRHQNEPQKSAPNSVKKSASNSMKKSASNSKSSSFSATQKSWPSTPSPARTPTGPTSTNSTPTNRKPHTATSAVRSTKKVENLQPRLKTLKATQSDVNKRIRATNEKKHPTKNENRKTTNADTKPSFINKVTKKNSVVPLETKPFLRKGSGIKTRVVAQAEEACKTSGGLIQSEEEKVVTRVFDITDDNQEKECETPEQQVVSPPESEELELSGGGGGVSRVEVAEERLEISPTAWVVMEEENNDEDEIIPCPANDRMPGGFSCPRVRHSLSEMLLEERNEGDYPTMVYQKDAAKGLKRLLKFARKSKADDWSSSLSAFSEEDDADESKATRSFFSLSAFRGNKTNEMKLNHR